MQRPAVFACGLLTLASLWLTKDSVAQDYTDWNVGVNRTWGLFTLGLGYYGTDGNGRDNSGKLADNRVVFTVAVGQ